MPAADKEKKKKTYFKGKTCLHVTIQQQDVTTCCPTKPSYLQANTADDQQAVNEEKNNLHL